MINFLNNLLHPAKNIATVHFENRDLIIADPCYFVNDGSIWENYCEDFAKNMNIEKLGATIGISWSVGDVYKDLLINTDTKSTLGKLSTDSYILGCFCLDEILKHNPDFEKELGTCPLTIIKNFTGDVSFVSSKEDVYNDGDTYQIITIIGKGSTNFKSIFGEE